MGTLQLDNRGEGKVRLSSVAQDPAADSIIELVRPGVGVFATGTFG